MLVAVFGHINWPYAIALLVMVYAFAICFSILFLLIEELTYHQYKKKTDVLKFVLVALFEPFYYHPFLVYTSLKGNWDLLRGKSSWG